MASNVLGKSGRYLIVLNCDSENGLSFVTCEREWVLVTPGSASRSATGLDAIDGPRSGCKVGWSGSMGCLVHRRDHGGCANRNRGSSVGR